MIAENQNLDAEVRPMMTRLSRIADQTEMLKAGNDFIHRFPPERALKVATAMSFANPFFTPDVPREAAEQLAVPIEDFSEITMRAKMAVRRAEQANILVACAPKSASTFIQAALQQALNLPSACLFAATLDWGSAATHVAHLREQDLDELALIRAGLNRQGYVAHHHARCSLYTARQIQFYNIKPIVTYRNIFDTIVSLDDMVMELRQNEKNLEFNYFLDGLPMSYHTLAREDRLMILAQRQSMWLIQFYVTWRRCAAEIDINPFWISYEDDFLGDKSMLANRLADYIGHEFADPARILSAFENKNQAREKRINQGVAGRGNDVPEAVRDYVLTAAKGYAGTWDLTPLVGKEHA